MKAYCKSCEAIQPSSFRPCTDAVTGASYEDLCCDSCHYIVATIEEREALAQPAQEPRLDQGPDYERGFIDGMQKQAQSSVDKAVNRMAQRPWVDLTDADIESCWNKALWRQKQPHHIFARAVLAKSKELNNG